MSSVPNDFDFAVGRVFALALAFVSLPPLPIRLMLFYHNTVLRLTWVYIMIMSVALGACRREASMRPAIAVTAPQQQWIVEQLTEGDSLDVVCLMGTNTDPETAEPTMSDLALIERATLYFTLGDITPFEHTAIDKIAANNPDVKIVSTVTDITLLTDEHDDAAADPHVCQSARNLRAMAGVMTARLVSRYPNRADAYRRRLHRLDSTLNALDDSLSLLLNGAPSRAFVVWHPSFSYFARDYRLRQIAIDDGHELTALHLRQRIDLIKRSGARVMIIQKGIDSREAVAIARDLHLRVVTVGPMTNNPQQQLLPIAYALAR